MTKLYVKLRARLAERDRGATAVEYGLMVALIAAVIVAFVAVLGGQINTAFQTVCNEITTGACP
jgi:pilus assembly protein Flp/PilA